MGALHWEQAVGLLTGKWGAHWQHLCPPSALQLGTGMPTAHSSCPASRERGAAALGESRREDMAADASALQTAPEQHFVCMCGVKICASVGERRHV